MKKLFYRGNFLWKSFSKKIRSIFKVATMKIKVVSRTKSGYTSIGGNPTFRANGNATATKRSVFTQLFAKTFGLLTLTRTATCQ